MYPLAWDGVTHEKLNFAMYKYFQNAGQLWLQQEADIQI